MRVVSLVDFDNDCVGTALKVARALGEKLYAVRLDTAENMVDRSLAEEAEADGAGGRELRGVNRWLVHKVREALDRNGFGRVRIVVSEDSTAPASGASARTGFRWTPTGWARP